ncbi:hypothetical protein CYMTET_9116 [Cymbomonas tetramitiformis]|uniref:RRM domain-containing protein n=1 Tax=Cymbomonas tetramitiformis TaxID=36881 RepID=A0AAE0LFT9_9CHLO|nr:hypothetical protein CYMTET_9116 [Cymbomonas tetramitiformis]
MPPGKGSKGPKKTGSKPTPSEPTEDTPAMSTEGPMEDATEEQTEEMPAREARRSVRLKRAADAPPKPGCVIYLGHIPHGFYENEMRGFFSQFGKVNRLRLARCKKTTSSKHYAYLEFAHAEVAPIAAEAMNNYLMFQKILKCHVVPTEDLHPNLFKGADRPFRKKPWKEIERERHNQDRTPAQEAKRLEKLTKREQQRRAKLEAAGIEYDFEGYESKIAPPSKHSTFDD